MSKSAASLGETVGLGPKRPKNEAQKDVVAHSLENDWDVQASGSTAPGLKMVTHVAEEVGGSEEKPAETIHNRAAAWGLIESDLRN